MRDRSRAKPAPRRSTAYRRSEWYGGQRSGIVLSSMTALRNKWRDSARSRLKNDVHLILQRPTLIKINGRPFQACGLTYNKARKSAFREKVIRLVLGTMPV